jgi:signal peptidase II
MARRVSLMILILMVLGLVGCDHATKAAAVSQLADNAAVQVIPGVLDLTYAENTDMAFGALRWIPAGARRIFLLATGFGLIAGFGWILVRRRPGAIESLGYATALAGGLGNHGDRLFRGYVVDFIHLHHWPVFNVADVCLLTGCALILLGSWRAGRQGTTVHSGTG